MYSGLPEVSGISLGGGSTASAILGLGTSTGVLIVPAFVADSLVNMDFPKEGVLQYRSDIHQVGYYNGIDWIYPGYTSALSASIAEATQNVQGLRVGNGTKDPNALLQIIDAERGLGIPVLHTDDVQGPHAGLILFDPELKAVCLFDGIGWKVVK